MANSYQFPYSKTIRENGEVISPNDHNKQENQIECLTDILGNYDFSAGSVESRLDILGGKTDSNLTDITTIQSDILVIQGDVVTINGSITMIQNDIVVIQGDIASINGSLTSLDARITSLENAPDPVSDLNDLGDVIVDTPEVGQVLTYVGPIGTGSEWRNQFPVRTLNELQDVSIDNAKPGDSLVLAPSTGTGGDIWVPEDRRITVASGLPGSPQESEVFPVSEIRFISDLGTGGGNHQVVPVKDGVVYVGAGSPPAALSSLTGLTNLISGKMSDDPVLNATTYPPSLNAGDLYSSLTQISSWTFTTAGDEFSNASLGNLILNINGVDVANIDLAANFVESNREIGQNILDYDNAGTGSTIVDGVVTFAGGTLKLNSVSPFNGVPVDQYQIGSATISLTSTSLRKGYNIIILRHEVGTIISSATLEWFYDTNAAGTNDPVISASDLSENTPSLVYLSGVSYYGTGSTFDLDITVDNLFDNVYISSDIPIVYSQNWANSGSIIITDPSVSGVSTPPLIGDVMTVTNFALTVTAGLKVTDARTTLTPSDPYGSYASVTTLSKNFTIMSDGPNSTDVFDDFTDERYRLPNTTNFDAVLPSMPPLLWDSTISLTAGARAGELQVYDHLGTVKNKIKYPTFNYSASFNPQPNPDYSMLPPGSKTYYRVFKSTSGDKTSGIITFPGISESDLTAGITLRIKVPSRTVWLDLSSDFNAGTFPTGAALVGGLDGEGCRINSGVNNLDINGSIEFSLGTIGTDLSSDRQLILEITYASSAVSEIIGSGSGLSINW